MASRPGLSGADTLISRPSGLNSGMLLGSSKRPFPEHRTLLQIDQSGAAIGVGDELGPLAVGWRITSPRKNPSITGSAEPPVAGTRQVTSRPSRVVVKTIQPASGDHTGQ